MFLGTKKTVQLRNGRENEAKALNMRRESHTHTSADGSSRSTSAIGPAYLSQLNSLNTGQTMCLMSGLDESVCAPLSCVVLVEVPAMGLRVVHGLGAGHAVMDPRSRRVLDKHLWRVSRFGGNRTHGRGCLSVRAVKLQLKLTPLVCVLCCRTVEFVLKCGRRDCGLELWAGATFCRQGQALHWMITQYYYLSVKMLYLYLICASQGLKYLPREEWDMSEAYGNSKRGKRGMLTDFRGREWLYCRMTRVCGTTGVYLDCGLA
ncbi:hypothetical protein C8R43DRAFT_1109449 [Mycena crocata]|nr:hypothetical protein C8R43DRAFT_1109449 [Mycena crocata]